MTRRAFRLVCFAVGLTAATGHGLTSLARHVVTEVVEALMTPDLLPPLPPQERRELYDALRHPAPVLDPPR